MVVVLTIVGELKGLVVILVAKELDHSLKGVFGRGGDAELIGLDRNLDLGLQILNVLVDLLSESLVDSLDDMTDKTNRTTGRGLRVAPGDALDVDAALEKLAVKDIEDLTGHKVGGSADRKGLILLGKVDASTGVLKIVALRELAGSLLVCVVDLLHVDLGNDIEA